MRCCTERKSLEAGNRSKLLSCGNVGVGFPGLHTSPLVQLPNTTTTVVLRTISYLNSIYDAYRNYTIGHEHRKSSPARIRRNRGGCPKRTLLLLKCSYLQSSYYCCLIVVCTPARRPYIIQYDTDTKLYTNFHVCCQGVQQMHALVHA